jgi:DNA-binding NtrC family response regulator
VRELENVAEKWTVLRRLLDAEAATALALESFGGHEACGSGSMLVAQGRDWCEGSLEAITRRAALAVLDEEGGNISKAARRLGIDRQTLRKHLKS